MTDSYFMGFMSLPPIVEVIVCCECGQPVPPLEAWQQVVEGGAGVARGHRACIEAEWGPTESGGE